MPKKDEHFLKLMTTIKRGCIEEQAQHLNKKQLTVVSLGCGKNCFNEASQLAHAFVGQEILYYGFDIDDLTFDKELPFKIEKNINDQKVSLTFNFHRCDTSDINVINQYLSKKADIILLRHPLFGIPQTNGAYVFSEKCPMALTCRNIIPEISAEHCTLIVSTYREIERDNARKYLFAADMSFLIFSYENGDKVSMPEGMSSRDKFCIIYPDYQPELVKLNRKKISENQKNDYNVLKCMGFFAATGVVAGLAYMTNQTVDSESNNMFNNLLNNTL